MGPGTGRSGGPRATPADTLRALAGDISDYLASRGELLQGIAADPAYAPRAASGREALAQIINRTPEEGRARFDEVFANPFMGAMPVAGIFAGVGAKTADLAKLRVAEDMAGKGAEPEAIRAATGWFQGPDQKWRFEIPDDAARLTSAGDGPASAVLQHDELFKAYPELAQNPVERAPPRYGGEGSFDPSTGEISISPRLDNDRARSTLLHELQHAVQQNEEFARGGSLVGAVVNNDARKVFAKLYKERLDAILDPGTLENFAKSAGFDSVAEAKPFYDQHVKNLAEMRRKGVPSHLDLAAQETAQRQTYERMAGEVEARDVQSRADFTPEQRAATAPYSSQGIAPDDMIVLPRSGGVQASEELPMDEASRAARATEMGFTTDAYHGTSKDFRSARPSNQSGMSQDMFFVAENPRFANQFADASGWIDRGKYMGQTRGSNVMPMKVDASNVLDVSNPEHKAGLVDFLANRHGMPTKDAAAWLDRRTVNGRVDWSFGDAADYAKQAGFSGVRFNDAGNEPSIGFFDTRKVRSRFAAFDPAKRDSTDLLAALGPLLAVMGIGAGAMGVDREPAEQ